MPMTTEDIMDKLEAGVPMRIKTAGEDRLAAVYTDQHFEVDLSGEDAARPVRVSFPDFTLSMTAENAALLSEALSDSVREWRSFLINGWTQR